MKAKLAKIGSILLAVLIGAYLIIFYPSWSGTYKFDSMIVNGMQLEEGDEFLGMTITDDFVILELDGDGDFVLRNGNTTASGVWEKGELRFNDGRRIKMSKSFGTITMAKDGTKFTLKKPLFF